MTALNDDLPEIDFTHWLAELRAAVAESVNGNILRGARAVSVSAGLAPGNREAGTQRPASSAGALVGYALRNPSLSDPATVLILDGRDANAPVLIPVALPPATSVTQWFGPGGIHFGDAGLFVVQTSESGIEGSVFLRGVE